MGFVNAKRKVLSTCQFALLLHTLIRDMGDELGREAALRLCIGLPQKSLSVSREIVIDFDRPVPKHFEELCALGVATVANGFGRTFILKLAFRAHFLRLHTRWAMHAA